MGAWERAILYPLLALLIAFAALKSPSTANVPKSHGIYASNGTMAAYDQFILFGDSLFQHSSSQERGFTLAPALQAEYVRRLDIVNRGFSGYNTNQALKILPRALPPKSYAGIRFFVVLLGANDACLPGAAGSQHVPLAQYKQNLKDIITHPAVTEHKPRIIVVTPPPINEYLCEENDKVKGYFDPRRKAEYTAMYSQAAKDVATDAGVVCLDLWKIFMKHAGWEEGDKKLPGSKSLPPNIPIRHLLHDGLHFTNVAYTMFFEELVKLIAETWPDQTQEKLPFVFPVWNDEKSWPVEENGLAHEP